MDLYGRGRIGLNVAKPIRVCHIFLIFSFLGSVQVLRHQVRGGWGLKLNDDNDDAFEGGGVWDLNDGVILE